MNVPLGLTRTASGGIALVAVPVAGVWLVTGLDLGHRQEKRAAAGSDPVGPRHPMPSN
ncbi:MAG: hypothetical protein KAI98_01555 [Gemmatimonadetes bacterium]|nr:hypothetical protein [Gemmatimonadota bacterium]